MRNTTTPRARRAWYTLALALGLAVAATGYISSFANLSRYASAHGWPHGALLPIGLDLGIPALLILDWLRASVFLRGGAWVLAAGTVAANGAVAGGTPRDRLLHAVMPALAIVIIEAARHLRDDPSRMDRIRASRWLLSPVRTPRLWRRMVLWEITSYSEALARESAILHARTVLAAAYGHRSWRRTRRHVPVSLAHQLATGQLPSTVLYGTDLQTAVRDWIREALAELDPVSVAVPEADSEAAEEAWWDRYGTGPQEAVWEMVQEALADLTPGPDAIPERDDPPEAVSEAVPQGPKTATEKDPWDRIWDRLDGVVPDGLTAVQQAIAYALARRHFEQFGRHIAANGLCGPVGIGKGRALALAKALRTAYETEADPRSPQRSEDPGDDHPADPLPETGAGPDGTTGPVGGPVPAHASA